MRNLPYSLGNRLLSHAKEERCDGSRGQEREPGWMMSNFKAVDGLHRVERKRRIEEGLDSSRADFINRSLHMNFMKKLEQYIIAPGLYRKINKKRLQNCSSYSQKEK